MNPILVTRTRGEVVESFHRGAICMVNENGDTIFSVGNENQSCFSRSALKLIQIIPLLLSGGHESLGLSMKELSVICGSHNGESEHLEAVRSILAKAGLTEAYLKCGAQYPTLRADRTELYKRDAAPLAIHNNCSGKHAGFLAACVVKGYSLEDYLDPEHPLQKEIRQITARFYEIEEGALKLGEDGCSAPVFSAPLRNVAIAYKNLVRPASLGEETAKACTIVTEAVAKEPFMVAGRQRYCTDMMLATQGAVIGKTGADGVFCLCFPESGIGCAIKVDDGKMGPQYTVAQNLLMAMGYPQAKHPTLERYINPPIKNWNKHVVGTESVPPDLFKGLPRIA